MHRQKLFIAVIAVAALAGTAFAATTKSDNKQSLQNDVTTTTEQSNSTTGTPAAQENDSFAAITMPVPETASIMTVATLSPIPGDSVNDVKVSVITPGIAKEFILKSDADLTAGAKFLHGSSTWQVTRHAKQAGIYWLASEQPVTGSFDFYLTLTTDGAAITVPIGLIGARTVDGTYFKVLSATGKQATFEKPLPLLSPATPQKTASAGVPTTAAAPAADPRQ